MYIRIHLSIYGDTKHKLRTHGNVFSGIPRPSMEPNRGMQHPALVNADLSVNFRIDFTDLQTSKFNSISEIFPLSISLLA